MVAFEAQARTRSRSAVGRAPEPRRDRARRRQRPWPDCRPADAVQRARGARPRAAADPADAPRAPTRTSWAASARGATCWSSRLTEFDWQVLPIVAPHGRAADVRAARPRAARSGDRGVVRGAAQGGARTSRRPALGRRAAVDPGAQPARLGGRAPTAVVAAWVWCRRHPGSVRRAFRSDARLGGVPGRAARGARRARPRGRHAAGARPRRGGDALPDALLGRAHRGRARRRRPTCCTSPPPAGRRSPRSSTRRCTARRWCSPSTASTCARPTWPPRATATRRAAASPRRVSPAGWRAPPTRPPTSSRRSPTPTPTGRWASASTRRRSWCSTTGCSHPTEPTPAARHADRRVGRAHRPAQGHPHDAAGRRPDRGASCPARSFLHYGPVPRGEEAYGRSCVALHERLGLGERFRFMGPTTDPTGVVRAADVVLMTSISEGLPMSILEAMGQARPGRLDRRRRRARRRARLRRGVRARRRPRAGDGRRHAAAQPRAGLAAGAARPPSARPPLQRVGLHRRLPRPAAAADRRGRRAAAPVGASA